MPQSYASLDVHLVFSTKNRKNLITPEYESILYPYMGGIVRAHGCKLLEVGGMPDHTHLLVSMSRDLAVSNLVREVKCSSSKWIRSEVPNGPDFRWQAGYAAFSVSHSNVDTVQNYLRNQAEHHRKRTFKEELRFLLEAHHIPFEGKYLLD